MDSTDAQQIFEEIMELASLIGWTGHVIQNEKGQILGINLGSEEYLNYKQGRDPLKPTH